MWMSHCPRYELLLTSQVIVIIVLITPEVVTIAILNYALSAGCADVYTENLNI